MQINDIIWLESFADKIESKHDVSTEEVEEVFFNSPKYRKARRGRVKGEDLYYAYGQSDSGRYLFIVFIYKKTKDALIITARDMDKKERRKYAGK